MKRTWRMTSIFAAVFALCLAVLAPSTASAEAYLAEQSFVADPTELIAEYAPDTKAAVHSEIKGFQRLPESPGGVIAIGGGSSNTKVTTCQKEVLPGGAAGVASIGIRGPTTS